MTQSAADRKVGVIGLGAMGLGIAKTLRNHGYTVYACDARPGAAADFAKEGGVACATPAEVAAGVDVVVSVIGDFAHLCGPTRTEQLRRRCLGSGAASAR